MECAWELDTPLYELLIYRIAGNFRMVEIFVLREHHTKTKISLDNNVNMFYVTMLSCTNI